MTGFAAHQQPPKTARTVRPREVVTLTTRSRRVGAAALALTILLSTVAPALAEPIADKRAEADRVQAQITALDDRVEIAVEDYNEASDRLHKLNHKVSDTEDKIARLRKNTGRLQSHLYTRAAGMYRTGPFGFVEVLLNTKSFDQFSQTWDVLTDLNARDASTVKDLKEARKQSEEARKVLKEAQAEAKAEVKNIAAKRAEIRKQLAQRKRTLAGIKSDIAALIAAREAEERAAARRRMASSASTRVWLDPGGDPPKSGKGEQAVWWAMSRRGAPYVWGATGPSTFDCSGLTSWAYAKVGVGIPRVSRDQIGAGARVSRDNLQPGDLVFFGRSRIHHVGMYIGAGMFVHAPSSGDVVKVSSLDTRGDYAGACRP
jgi:cell wall-associated NlpC family hydrolase